MPHLSAAATLDLWQEVEALGPIERTLALASAAGGSGDELAALPLGQRNAKLLSLHGGLGRRSFEATAPCPACGEQAEFSIDADALLARGAEAGPPHPVEAAGFVVVWRSPDSRDLVAAAEAGTEDAAERVLLARCVIAATGPGGDAAGTDLPAEVREALARAMAESDPLAEVMVDVSCPSCGSGFVADLDVGAFVWAEVRARARRLLRDVDVLARAYGWTEAEVFALDERRRAAYLELAGEGPG